MTALVFISTSGLADENLPAQEWDDVEGVTVQPKDRVDQINDYKKKSEESENKQLKQGWEQNGVTVQSEERVKHLNELQKARREKGIRELKCDVCTMRCRLYRDIGQTTCQDAQTSPDTGICRHKADNFLKSCLQHCEYC
ncbi:MAG: hypothetical protein L0Y38_00270 [Methylococcaceae bacterium]|nr:hypothetical protein [Methylococcaceae bacterium]MCI0732241.1 hypothetical protein [Methylococcaceae bacterium]